MQNFAERLCRVLVLLISVDLSLLLPSAVRLCWSLTHSEGFHDAFRCSLLHQLQPAFYFITDEFIYMFLLLQCSLAKDTQVSTTIAPAYKAASSLRL